MRFLNNTQHVVLNGRYQSPTDPIPYTLQRNDEKTINDYNTISINHFSKVKRCTVNPRNTRNTRSGQKIPSDHNPILLELTLPTQNAQSQEALSPTDQSSLPPRLLFHSSRLKGNTNHLKLFTEALEARSHKITKDIKTLKTKVQQKQIDIATFADEANTLIISALQHAAEKTLGRVSPPTTNQNKDEEEQEEQDEKDKQLTHYSSAHPEVKHLQTQAQHAKWDLRKAREEKAPLIDIKFLADSYVDKKNAMLKKQQELKQASLTQRVSQEPAAEVSSNPSNLKRMWDYLRSYKTDHAKSSLPTQLYSNASKDLKTMD